MITLAASQVSFISMEVIATTKKRPTKNDEWDSNRTLHYPKIELNIMNPDSLIFISGEWIFNGHAI